LSVGHRGQGFLHIGCVLHGVTIYFDDHVTALQAGVVGGAAGLHLLDDCAVDITRRLQLVTQFGSDVGEADAPARFAVTIAGDFFAFFVTAAHFLQRHRDAGGLAIAQDFQLDARTGLLLSDFDLKLAGVADFLAIEFGNDVADFQSGLLGWEPLSTWLITAPSLFSTWKNLAFSGVTSLMPIPM